MQLDINLHSTHAEINAYRRIAKWKNKPKKLDLIVLRFSKTGCLGKSRPCYNCLQRLTNAKMGIVHVYYSTENGTIIKENFNTMINNPLTYTSSGFRKMRWRNN